MRAENKIIDLHEFNESSRIDLQVVKRKLWNESIPLKTRTIAIQHVAEMENHDSVTKEELVNAIRWLFERYDFCN